MRPRGAQEATAAEPWGSCPRPPTAPPPESHRELSLQELRAAPPGGAGSPRSRGGGCAEGPHDLPHPAPPPTRSQQRLHVRSVVLNLAPLSPRPAPFDGVGAGHEVAP